MRCIERSKTPIATRKIMKCHTQLTNGKKKKRATKQKRTKEQTHVSGATTDKFLYSSLRWSSQSCHFLNSSYRILIFLP